MISFFRKSYSASTFLCSLIAMIKCTIVHLFLVIAIGIALKMNAFKCGLTGFD